MADHLSPIVIQQSIPIRDMRPLERLVLSNICDAEPDGDALYFCSGDGPNDTIWLPIKELRAAIDASTGLDSTAFTYVVERLAGTAADETEIEIDFSGTSWEFIFQDIVRRSPTLEHMTAVTSFTCPKMRPDGFGGMAVLMTANAIAGKSTENIMRDLLDQAEHGPIGTAPGFGVHVLLELAEKSVRSELAHVLATDKILATVGADAVTDADIRAGCAESSSASTCGRSGTRRSSRRRWRRSATHNSDSRPQSARRRLSSRPGVTCPPGLGAADMRVRGPWRAWRRARRSRECLPAGPSRRPPMAQSVQKITLSASRDIPFNKLLLSACNVRRIKAGVSIEQLADDIGRRTLLQSLTVRPVLDAAGIETGMYEIPAGGRRFRALELLVKQKRLAKTAPIPCVIREGGIAEEDSLAENVQRAPLHPLDQFRAFLALREKGQSEEEIAAAFFVSVAVVKQRLRLASVAPKLLEVYADDGLTLDQLMAFTVNGDHERQEQVFDRLNQSYTKEAYVIRRMLTEGAVRAADKRALFVGIDAYEEAGGTVMRDLFQGDDGGWLQDPALLDQLVVEKLQRDAETVAAEGWKWIEVAPDFAYGRHFGLRQLRGDVLVLSAEEEMTRDALRVEYDQLEDEYAQVEEVPEEIDQRMTEIETMLGTLDDRPVTFDSDEIARAGAFVSIDGAGALKVERGYIRPEDELPIPSEPEAEVDPDAGSDEPDYAAAYAPANSSTVHGSPEVAPEPEEEDGIKPLPDRLLTELTAHRTLALRNTIGEQPEVAFLAALHALTLRLFYGYGLNSCLELDVKSVTFNAQAPGLNDTAVARALTGRHQFWLSSMPKHPEDLWSTLSRLDVPSQQSLFAHCVGLSVNGVHEAYNRRPQALAHADVLAKVLDLDMAAAGWTPTVDTYLGRVTKARILQAVREAKGEHAAQSIDHLKKGEMAEKAEALLAGSGWLPEPLRTPGRAVPTGVDTTEAEAADVAEPAGEEMAADGGKPAMVEEATAAEDEPVAIDTHAIAAE